MQDPPDGVVSSPLVSLAVVGLSPERILVPFLVDLLQKEGVSASLSPYHIIRDINNPTAQTQEGKRRNEILVSFPLKRKP